MLYFSFTDSTLLEQHEMGVFFVTMFTGVMYAIGTPVAYFAMPFPPVPACMTHIAVPGTTALHNFSPAEREPIHLLAPLARVFPNKGFEGHFFVFAREFKEHFQLLIGQGFVSADILYGTFCQPFDDNAV